MKKIIISGLKKLESSGCNLIAMPCNSAHLYYDNLIKHIDIPLLNIIDITTKNINKNTKKVTLFATETTFQAKLYQDALINQSYHFYFEESWQAIINQIILSIKENKPGVSHFDFT